MIAVAALASRLVLAAVFAVAGLSKLVDRAGTRAGLAEFGVPMRLVAVTAVVVPLAELTVAALLIPATTAVAGALGALVLLVLFSAVVAINLARGRAPACHCFGQLHSAPASTRTLVRNGVLAGVAILALWGLVSDDAQSPVAWLGQLEPSEVVAVSVGVAAALLLVLGAVAFVTLMRSYGEVLLRLERAERALLGAGIGLEDRDPPAGIAPGAPAPWFLGATLDGAGVSLDDLLAPGRPLLLLFTSPHCGPCATLLPEAAVWQREHADVLTIAFASEGAADEVAAEVRELGLEGVLVDASREIAASFEVTGTPSAVLIGPDGTMAGWLASGSDEIETLVAHALRGGDEDGGEGLRIGTEAPVLTLPALDGDPVSLADLRGREALLLFWNPGCGFCRSMHEDILAWESTANGDGPRLVVVSSGDEEGARAEGFASTVLLDPDYTAGEAFGALGTPMAVLLDLDGRIGSPVAAGAESVLALANDDAGRRRTR